MRTVVEVARTESITAAAHTLGLTQSAVSRTVAELETALGQRLFERSSRGTQITDAGRRLVARAKRLLADVDDLIDDISTASQHVTGRLRLGLGITGHHLCNAIAAFAGRHPEPAGREYRRRSGCRCKHLRGEALPGRGEIAGGHGRLIFQ